MLCNEDGSQQCMSYPDFQRKLNEPQFSQHFMPLLALLEDVKPSDDCRWRRLQETRQALENFRFTAIVCLECQHNPKTRTLTCPTIADTKRGRTDQIAWIRR